MGLTVEHAYRIGRFLGWYYGREHKCSVVIGKDTRRSSYMFENALSAGLTASGADAYLMHVTTTPSVSYIVRSDDFDCGIMISASHNPFTDNGIKLLNSAGEKMEQSVIDEIENYLDGNLEIPFATGANIGRTQDYSAGRNRYIGYLISLSTHSYKGMKVGLDCANGSTWMMAKNIFDALGADTYVIGNEPDGTNINRDCGSTHIENLQKYVRLNRLDVGFAFDGDADRCLAVDENGSVVNGDKILYVCARNMQAEGRFGNSKVVTTVMSNLGLYKALDEAGIGYEKTDVGDKYVAENMRANGHLIGGEQSGHIIFGKYANTGDGLLTAIKLMQVMLDRKKTLSELAAPVREYPQQLTNVEVDDKDATLNDPAVVAAGQAVTERLGDEGRILFDNVQTPHFNYVGDSILGYKSHMGAGSITSNVKSDKTLVVIKNGAERIETGRKKVGAILGDYVEVGCNSVLNPGTVIGRHSNIYPVSCVRGVIPADSILKSSGEVVHKK